MKKIVFFLPVLALLASCGGAGKNDQATGSSDGGTVQIDGSSTVYPITEAIAEEFQAENKNLKVTAGESGTGGGMKKFGRKEIDICDASRPIKANEDSVATAGGIAYYELPIAYDGLVVVVNPQNTWLSSITVKELKMIWEPGAQGKITKWNQIRKEWPNEEIHLYGAGTASGTFDYFTEAIVGKSKSCRGDYTGSEDDNVLVQGVSSDKLALGFFGFHYYTENKDKLKIVAIDDEKEENGKGPIIPSEETVKNATYQPLSRPLFIYVNKSSAERPEVDGFVKYYLDNAADIVPETGYITLDPAIYAQIKKRYQDKITGSLFLSGKSSVGVKLDELYK
ncbi:MAG TPA: PstS family phosphate ABC transporter substrate-binding protein [Cytophagaceae bacterium]|jgi:phosphate transport system substrate-binding protein|nr:PstS family phosphate ABC transporter substrate-binding protein [Cytophagaceae bacterium]